MTDFDRSNSVNNDLNNDLINDNNDDSDNNTTQNGDNDTAMTNILHRNNFTAREHLFQAMFSRIALTYDRTFPPFARRFIEFMLLMTALSVLFILIYIHLAFVKAPITCLDHFSFEQLIDHGDSSLKHVVIRVEILSNPPLNYGLFNSYSKEYDDVNAATESDNNSSLPRSRNEFTQKAMFLNIINKKCHKENIGSTSSIKDSTESGTQTENTNDNINADQNQSHGSFYRLFHFPFNPIIEKAEYWREKLSVRAMAPFRQTFNELELFAKSVFTEEKYIMEYSLEYGLLRLSPQTRERLNIPVHFVLLDATNDKCFGNSLSRFILQEFVGYDQIIIGSLKRLAERQSGKGYVRNVVSGEHYRFVNSWMSRTSYLAAGFIMIIFTLSVSMLLRYSHHQIFVFIVDLLRMLENNLQFSFPAAPLLTVVLALVGMEAIMSEFFNDTSTAFYTILIIWLADQYEAVCCRTYVSKRHWPRYFYLYHFAFYAYHYRFNGQFSGLALLCSWLFIQHSMFFFFHHYELPRLMQSIAVRAIMDSLIVERAENSSMASVNVNPNDDDDSDMQGGDRRDNDEDPGSSNMPATGTANGTLSRRSEHKPPSQNNHTQTSSNPSGENHYSNNANSESNLNQMFVTVESINIRSEHAKRNNCLKNFLFQKKKNLDECIIFIKYQGHSQRKKSDLSKYVLLCTDQIFNSYFCNLSICPKRLVLETFSLTCSCDVVYNHVIESHLSNSYGYFILKLQEKKILINITKKLNGSFVGDPINGFIYLIIKNKSLRTHSDQGMYDVSRELIFYNEKCCVIFCESLILKDCLVSKIRYIAVLQTVHETCIKVKVVILRKNIKNDFLTVLRMCERIYDCQNLILCITNFFILIIFFLIVCLKNQKPLEYKEHRRRNLALYYETLLSKCDRSLQRVLYNDNFTDILSLKFQRNNPGYVLTSVGNLLTFKSLMSDQFVQYFKVNLKMWLIENATLYQLLTECLIRRIVSALLERYKTFIPPFIILTVQLKNIYLERDEQIKWSLNNTDNAKVSPSFSFDESARPHVRL